MHRVFDLEFAKLYPLYLAKVEKKGRTQAELDEVLTWLTSFTKAELQEQIDKANSLRTFFDQAHLTENATQITGVICGVLIEQIDDPLMRKIRYMDKVVDDLAKGRPLEKILRK